VGNTGSFNANAHPHSAGGVVVVHNGIIENYRELKRHLISEGCEFSSDTDTEVIPHMISSNIKRGLSVYEAVKEIIPRLSGTFALGIMSETEPHTIYAVRKEALWYWDAASRHSSSHLTPRPYFLIPTGLSSWKTNNSAFLQ
jgi:glucosamine 6-phosphate synthetase-like amidotransferase/phosphosugar isomerase protein